MVAPVEIESGSSPQPGFGQRGTRRYSRDLLLEPGSRDPDDDRAVTALPEESRRKVTAFFASTESERVSVETHTSSQRLILRG